MESNNDDPRATGMTPEAQRPRIEGQVPTTSFQDHLASIDNQAAGNHARARALAAINRACSSDNSAPVLPAQQIPVPDDVQQQTNLQQQNVLAQQNQIASVLQQMHNDNNLYREQYFAQLERPEVCIGEHVRQNEPA